MLDKQVGETPDFVLTSESVPGSKPPMPVYTAASEKARRYINENDFTNMIVRPVKNAEPPAMVCPMIVVNDCSRLLIQMGFVIFMNGTNIDVK